MSWLLHEDIISIRNLILGNIAFTVILVFSIFIIFRKSFLHLENGAYQISQGAMRMSQFGSRLAKISRSLSDSAKNSAANIEETSASLNELNSMISQNAKNSKEAQDLTVKAMDAARSGNQEMRSLEDTMGEIYDSSQKIQSIMEIIDDISFQTNLLALNASVEAARAGEQGRGFSVVAEAVRTLAQRSAESARQTGDLVRATLEKVEKGKTGVHSTSESMKSIVQSIEKTVALNTEIAQASHEQALGVTQITKVLSSLEEITTKNSDIAESSQSYAQTSVIQSNELIKNVELVTYNILGRVIKSNELNGDFQIGDAINTHMQWKERLEKFIAGDPLEKFTSTDACADNKCRLGKWIYKEGLQFERLPEYKTLKMTHAEFHKAAGEIVRATEQGEAQRAKQLLNDEQFFIRKTQATVSAIESLEREMVRH